MCWNCECDFPVPNSERFVTPEIAHAAATGEPQCRKVCSDRLCEVAAVKQADRF